MAAVAGAVSLVVLAGALLLAARPPRVPNAAEVSANVPAALALLGEPTVLPGTLVTRSWTSACSLPPDHRPCDVFVEALWKGDPAAWQALAAQYGQAPPNEAAIQESVLQMRLRSGEPAARIIYAERQGLPALFLTAARFAGSRTDPAMQEIAVEIANLGVTMADLGEMRVVDDEGNVAFRLPAGAMLAPGARCWLGSSAPAGASCAFVPAGAGSLPGDVAVPLTLLTPLGKPLDTLAP